MADLSGAKSIYSWIVEPDSDNTTWNARKIKQDTEEVTNYSDVVDMFTDINTDLCNGSGKVGGRVGVRNGVYGVDIDPSEVEAVIFGHSSTQTGASIILEGESKYGAVLKNLTEFVSDAVLFGTICNLEVRNLTFDGNLKGPGTYLVKAMADGHVTPVGYMNAFNCRFQHSNGYSFRMGYEELWEHTIVRDCEFINANESNDQCSIHPLGYGIVDANYFYRDGNGSNITPGQGRNIVISNNRIDRTVGSSENTISLEPFSGLIENHIVHSNIINNGTIKVGQSGTWIGQVRNCNIFNNIITGGNIQIFGPTTGSYTDRIRNVYVENNKILYSRTFGLKVNHCDGLVSVKNNTIVDSNTSLAAAGADTGLMRLANSKNVICENNNLYMGVTSPENALYSSHGIRYENLTDSKMQKNRIYNYTLAPNPSYVKAGSSFGGVNVFSLDL